MLSAIQLRPAASSPPLPHPPTLRSARAVTMQDVADAGSKVKIKIKVKSPSEKAAAASAAPPPADPVADANTKVTVNVRPKANATAAATQIAAPSPPPSPAYSPAEEELLAATQAANCTRMLAALQDGANPNIRDPKGRTPLHFMSGVGLAPACVLLIHFGAQLEVTDEMGLTPLHMAAGYSNAQTLKVLIAAGVDIERQTDQGTALDVVKRLGEYQYLQVFMNKTQNKFSLKKKDDKLEALKACALALDDSEAVKSEQTWTEMVREVLKTIAI